MTTDVMTSLAGRCDAVVELGGPTFSRCGEPLILHPGEPGWRHIVDPLTAHEPRLAPRSAAPADVWDYDAAARGAYPTYCLNPTHDHTTLVGPDGETLTKPTPMNCVHCATPAHYDTTCEDYVHDNGPDCPLARATDDSNPCQH